MAIVKNNAPPAATSTFDERPKATISTPVVTNSAPRPLASANNACTADPRRVVRPASRTSQRPASSSPRSSLVAVRIPHTEPVMARTVRHFHTVKPDTVSMRNAGPTSALMPGFEPNSFTRSRRAASLL